MVRRAYDDRMGVTLQVHLTPKRKINICILGTPYQGGKLDKRLSS